LILRPSPTYRSGLPRFDASPRGLSVFGHSKWATIERKKASIDAKRGAAFRRWSFSKCP